MARKRLNREDPYRPLNSKEKDVLFSYYDKHNKNMSAMVRDPDCIFKSFNQISFYCRRYNFEERYLKVRQARAEQVKANLGDGKIQAIEAAMKLIAPRQELVYDMFGRQKFDVDGNPVIIEKYPHYKEIKVAYEILKTELGEPTSINKTDHTSLGEKIDAVTVRIIRSPDEIPRAGNTSD